jgi:hypothetical protein
VHNFTIVRSFPFPASWPWEAKFLARGVILFAKSAVANDDLVPCVYTAALPQILPKKSEVQVAKCEGKVNVIMVEDEPLFYNGVYVPSSWLHFAIKIHVC